MRRDSAIERYLQDAQSWEVNRADQAERGERRAWAVAGASGLIALVCAAAVVGLTPLKQPVPVVIRVDSSTGIVDVAPTYAGTEKIEQVVTRHLLNNYVIARERYFYGTAEADYELVAAQNSPTLNQEWTQRWARTNALSPLNLYKDGTTIRVQIHSISFLKLESGRNDLAQVRFTQYLRAGGTGGERATHWLAMVEYAYTPPSTDDKVRSLNPLGFRVVEYRREQEVPGDASPANKGQQP
jgi:type IV secretion system protein VirB8